MNKPDCRAALAEIADLLDQATDPDDLGIRAGQAIVRARALLSAPEAVEDANRLRGKYIIHRSADGRPVEFPCFVLRMDGKDPAAMAAIWAYCQAPTCPPELANDIERQFGWLQAWKRAAPEAVGQAVAVPLASRGNDWRDGYITGWNEALTQSDTPEAVGVADEEILRLASKALGYVHIRADAKELEADAGELIAFARALLSHCGAAYPAPVPVGERLPGDQP